MYVVDFLMVFVIYQNIKLPFVGFCERGELKKNLQVGSIYLRAKEKRVDLRPTESPWIWLLTEGHHCADSSGMQQQERCAASLGA